MTNTTVAPDELMDGLPTEEEWKLVWPFLLASWGPEGIDRHAVWLYADVAKFVIEHDLQPLFEGAIGTPEHLMATAKRFVALGWAASTV